MNIGLISYLSAVISYLMLVLLLVFSWRRNAMGTRVLIAGLLTLVWAAVSASSILVPLLSHRYLQVTELARDAGWCLFMLSIVGSQNNVAGSQNSQPETRSTKLHWKSLYGLFLAVACAVILIAPGSFNDGNSSTFFVELTLVMWVATALIGLLIVEQLFRNTDATQRWSIKYLCIGLGVVFAYDFYLYSEALLFRQVNRQLWDARGFVNAIATPLIAISIARNPTWNLGIHVSRKIVFQSATLLGAGVYLLAMAGTGYFVRYYGGTWGGVLQVTFLGASGILLLVLLFSDRIRARIRVLISKHFFSYKYDYREEWLKFTQTIANNGAEVPQRITKAIAQLVNSDGALLWIMNTSNQLEYCANWKMPIPASSHPDWAVALLEFIEGTGWIVDLDEYRKAPHSYPGLQLPDLLIDLEDTRLIVPLLVKSKPLGIVVLKRSNILPNVNWEDRDLLKMAGQQAAAHLAQFLSDKALIQARQFEAFNQLSAYVIHDLKNILAQQSLIVANAEKHRANPEFIDDVFSTIKNSVARMTRLMEQMRSGARGKDPSVLELLTLLKEVIARRSGLRPIPQLEAADDKVHVWADKELLSTVFGHIIQNAQEATDDAGQVIIRVAVSANQVTANQVTIEIEDTGAGMDTDFIENRLFKPFETTKGLVGMGIGLFESREYLQSLGGDVSVSSEPAVGSIFRVSLPRIETADSAILPQVAGDQ